MTPTLNDLLPYGAGVTNDLILDRFLDYVSGRGLALYPAQEEAILALAASTAGRGHQPLAGL